MMTLAADLRPAKIEHQSSVGREAAARAVPLLALVHSINTSQPWTDDPRAKRLLASCVALPPSGEWKRTRFIISEDDWFEYVGYRAEALGAIRDEYGRRTLAAYHRFGDEAYEPFEEWCLAPNVAEAIDAARTAAKGA